MKKIGEEIPEERPEGTHMTCTCSFHTIHLLLLWRYFTRCHDNSRFLHGKLCSSDWWTSWRPLRKGERERERPLVNDTARKRGRKDLVLFYFRSLLLMTKTQQSSWGWLSIMKYVMHVAHEYSYMYYICVCIWTCMYTGLLWGLCVAPSSNRRQDVSRFKTVPNRVETECGLVPPSCHHYVHFPSGIPIPSLHTWPLLDTLFQSVLRLKRFL